jgi:uncharacterized protein (TIGR03435 family)
MNARRIVLMLAFWPGAVAIAQEAGGALQIGDRAPEFVFEGLVQTPDEEVGTLAALRGKAVVLVFWEPWSRKCNDALTHLNGLVGEFRNQPIRFVTVTSTEEPIVRRLLREQRIEAWVWLDADRSMFKAYGAVPLPHMVLIDQQGKIAAITSAEDLTVSAIKDLLAGKPVSLPRKESKPVESKADEVARLADPEPLMEVVIGPSNKDPYEFRIHHDSHSRRLTAEAAPLPSMIAWAYKTPVDRIISHWSPSDQRYRVSILAPPGREDMVLPLFRYTIKKTFGLRISRKTRPTPCLVLKRLDGVPWALPASKAEKGRAFFGDDSIHATRHSVAALARLLEGVVGLPVFDETALEGKYDFQIRYSPGELDSLKEALHKLGLKLDDETRPVELLLVEEADTGSSQ